MGKTLTQVRSCRIHAHPTARTGMNWPHKRSLIKNRDRRGFGCASLPCSVSPSPPLFQDCLCRFRVHLQTMAPSTTIAEITNRDLQDLPAPADAVISDAKHLASYSWIEAAQPTIAIPGSPARWSPPAVPRRVKKDSGLIYIAQNAARHPTSPLEPLFSALYAEQASFDIRAVDLVTDRNNLRKLLSFVNPSSGRGGLEPFTIDVEVNDKTALFCRRETAKTVFLGPGDFNGYGHEFEKAYTANEIAASTGHHRIISYGFGGLSCIVRYEADGYVADTTSLPKTLRANNNSSTSGKTADNDGLVDLLASLSLRQTSDVLPAVTTTSALASTRPKSKLRTKTQGHAVAPESIVEMKTRVAHRPLAFREVAPQLWISQTTKLVRAYHDRGTFPVPRVEDVTANIQTWEDAHQSDLRKLAALISRILDVVREHGGPATVKCRQGKKDTLVVCSKTGGKKMLPKGWYLKWADEGHAKLGTAEHATVST